MTVNDNTVRHDVDDPMTQPTEQSLEVDKFMRRESGPRLIGLLRPVPAIISTASRLKDKELVVGCQPGALVVISDKSVSCKHARFTKNDDDFVVEDLSISNRKYLDGVPMFPAHSEMVTQCKSE